jgi:hypothetical protein
LSCLVLSCLVLSCLVLSCLVLSCLVLSWFGLSCLVLSCLVLSWLGLTWLVLAWLGLVCRVFPSLPYPTLPFPSFPFPFLPKNSLSPLLFSFEVVCDWTLLPLGFHATENVSGLDLADSTWLQSVLGIDLLLQELSVGGSKSTFGKTVHLQPEKAGGGGGGCFNFLAVDDASTFRGFDVEKALAQIRCPDRFAKNKNVNRPTMDMAEGSSGKFCVG